MKVFRDNICYVDFDDLTRFPIPSYFVMDNKEYKDGEMVILKDPKSIEYVRSRDDILDFDEISKLDAKELVSRIEEYFYEVDESANRLLDLSMKLRERPIDNEECMEEFKTKMYTLRSLAEYQKDKDKIDETIMNFISDNSKSPSQKKDIQR